MSILDQLLAERGDPDRDICRSCGGVFPLEQLSGRAGRPGFPMCESCRRDDPIEVLETIENHDNRPYMPERAQRDRT